MTPTTNLGLPVYGTNDVPQWDDTNTPFETLDSLVGETGVKPSFLDFDNAVTITNTAMTTTKTGAVIGVLANSNDPVMLTVNNKVVARAGTTPSFTTLYGLPVGTILKLTGSGTIPSPYAIWFVPYKKSVSTLGNAVSYPVFDFANPLFTFQNSTGKTSYTADHDCWLVGSFSMSAVGNCDLLIDGTLIGHARYNQEACQVPMQYKILNGSTVKISGATGTLYETLHILNEI